MKHTFIACLALLLLAPMAKADELAKKIRDDVKPSLVVVKYTWKSETVTTDLGTGGVVIGDDGLVAFPILIVSPSDIPEDQITNMKILVPSDSGDETELDAVYQGRDERTDLAFARTKEKQSWKSVKFVDVSPEIGDPVYSVALMPRSSGFRPNVTTGMISTRLRGPVAQYLVDGALAGSCAVVFDAREEAIGLQQPRILQEALLDSSNSNRESQTPISIQSPSRYFIPSSDFLPTLSNPPTPENPIVIPWVGLPSPKGVEKQMAEYLGIKGVPAVEVGDIVKGSPADKAGLQVSDVIVKMNGQPLERGDVPEEVPAIMTRRIQRQKPGDTITFSVIRDKAEPPKDITVTLEARPMEPIAAKRYYAKDIGMIARQAAFIDNFARKRDASEGGVAVAYIERGEAAAAATLQPGDLITEMAGKPVTDIDQFKKDYEQFRKDRPHDPIVFEVRHIDNRAAVINVTPPQQ